MLFGLDASRCVAPALQESFDGLVVLDLIMERVIAMSDVATNGFRSIVNSHHMF